VAPILINAAHADPHPNTTHHVQSFGSVSHAPSTMRLPTTSGPMTVPYPHQRTHMDFCAPLLSAQAWLFQISFEYNCPQPMPHQGRSIQRSGEYSLLDHRPINGQINDEMAGACADKRGQKMRDATSRSRIVTSQVSSSAQCTKYGR
jgi:hypothetical protein